MRRRARDDVGAEREVRARDARARPDLDDRLRTLHTQADEAHVTGRVGVERDVASREGAATVREDLGLRTDGHACRGEAQVAGVARRRGGSRIAAGGDLAGRDRDAGPHVDLPRGDRDRGQAAAAERPGAREDDLRLGHDRLVARAAAVAEQQRLDDDELGRRQRRDVVDAVVEAEAARADLLADREAVADEAARGARERVVDEVDGERRGAGRRRRDGDRHGVRRRVAVARQRREDRRADERQRLRAGDRDRPPAADGCRQDGLRRERREVATGRVGHADTRRVRIGREGVAERRVVLVAVLPVAEQPAEDRAQRLALPQREVACARVVDEVHPADVVEVVLEHHRRRVLDLLEPRAAVGTAVDGRAEAARHRRERLEVELALDERDRVVGGTHEAQRTADDVAVLALEQPHTDRRRGGDRERAELVERDREIRIEEVGVEQSLVGGERAGDRRTERVEDLIRRVGSGLHVRRVEDRVEVGIEAVDLLDLACQRVVEALRDAVEPRGLDAVGAGRERRLPLDIVGVHAGGARARRVQDVHRARARHAVRTPFEVAVDEPQPRSRVGVTGDAEDVEQDAVAGVQRGDVGEDRRAQMLVRAAAGGREVHGVDAAQRVRGVASPAVGVRDRVLDRDVQADDVGVDRDEVAAAVVQAADRRAVPAAGEVRDGLAGDEAVAGGERDRVVDGVDGTERDVAFGLGQRRRHDVAAVVADEVELRPVVGVRGRAGELGQRRAHERRQLAAARRADAAERVELLQQQHLRERHGVRVGGESRLVELDVVGQLAGRVGVELHAEDVRQRERRALRRPLDAEEAVDLVVVAVLEDRDRDAGDRHGLQIHLRVELRQLLELREVDAGGLADRLGDEVLDELLDLLQQRRDRREQEAHRRQHEVVDERAEVADARRQIADELRQAEHRQHAVVQERVVEVAVVIGVVELAEDDVEQPDLALVIGAVRVDAVVCGELVLPVARRLGIEQRVRHGEAEAPPLGDAGVDVRRPAREVGARQHLDVQRARIVRRVAVGEQWHELRHELVKGLSRRAAECEQQVVDLALDDEEDVDDRAAVAAHRQRGTAGDRRRGRAGGGCGDGLVGERLVDLDRRRGDGARVVDDRELAQVGGIGEAKREELHVRLEAVGDERPAVGAGERVRARVRRQAPARTGVGGCRRVAGERGEQRVEDVAQRRVEGDAGARVGADVAVGQQRAVVVAVVARSGVADVALEHEMADRVRCVAVLRLAGDDVEDRREDTFGELVDERVREEVAGGVGREAVGERQDLQPFVVRERVVGLGPPRHVEDAREPGARVVGVDDPRPERHVREAVRSDRPGVVVARVAPDRLEHARVDVVLGRERRAVLALDVDRDLAVLDEVRAHVLGDLDMRERLERDLCEDVAGVVAMRRVHVLVAEQVAGLVRDVDGERLRVVHGAARGDRQLVAEDERGVAAVAVVAVDLLGHAVERAVRGECGRVAADVDRRVLGAGGRTHRCHGGLAAEPALHRADERCDDGRLLPCQPGRRAEGRDVDAGDRHGTDVVHTARTCELEEHDLGLRGLLTCRQRLRGLACRERCVVRQTSRLGVSLENLVRRWSARRRGIAIGGREKDWRVGDRGAVGRTGVGRRRLVVEPCVGLVGAVAGRGRCRRRGHRSGPRRRGIGRRVGGGDHLRDRRGGHPVAVERRRVDRRRCDRAVRGSRASAGRHRRPRAGERDVAERRGRHGEQQRRHAGRRGRLRDNRRRRNRGDPEARRGRRRDRLRESGVAGRRARSHRNLRRRSLELERAAGGGAGSDGVGSRLARHDRRRQGGLGTRGRLRRLGGDGGDCRRRLRVGAWSIGGRRLGRRDELAVERLRRCGRVRGRRLGGGCGRGRGRRLCGGCGRGRGRRLRGGCERGRRRRVGSGEHAVKDGARGGIGHHRRGGVALACGTRARVLVRDAGCGGVGCRRGVLRAAGSRTRDRRRERRAWRCAPASWRPAAPPVAQPGPSPSRRPHARAADRPRTERRWHRPRSLDSSAAPA